MIELEWVSKVYKTGAIELRALDNANLRIEDGELVAIMGASGSGKSTMMNILGCLDMPTTGVYRLDGIDVGSLRENALADIRNKKIGFVFQSFNLIPRTSAIRNVELPMVYGGGSDRRARAERALQRVGLGERMYHMPNELSGGQQQRVAVARSLVMDPTMILADEPTGNLDTASTIEIMNLFVELNDSGRTVVLITHEPEVAAFAKRVITLRDGHIISDVRQEQKRDQVVPEDGHTEVFAAVTELPPSAPKHALDVADATAVAAADEVDPGEPTRPVLRKDLDR
ncbi:ABC transporter ATP-binding protein [Pseudonocardia sp. CA-107938]|uniref:ABC transporter ATP-binding protein n=1 Tax=Pseudonocardia sp. CA-107938 TaxID=3240021 RepID=UPI003D921A34